ncbi:hypothetical protein UFOVP136_21 [uncultured Caudovirales phage]|uniref:Uncharacterized protein n=1 Tax=uncultured Caudovirales phage TaxID=2100421 RepID=A0A6J5LFZ6_9CAUD|nr:hypothetical protein UFOVP136_21 [uncultured Caudovirales phage]
MTQIIVDLPDDIDIDVNELDMLMMQIAYYEGLMISINIPLKHEATHEEEVQAKIINNNFALDGIATGEVTMVLDITRAETGETEQVTLTGQV